MREMQILSVSSVPPAAAATEPPRKPINRPHAPTPTPPQKENPGALNGPGRCNIDLKGNYL